jgi:hypothetical protein
MPGIIAIAFVDIIKERRVAITAAEKRIADPAKIAASLILSHKPWNGAAALVNLLIGELISR